LLEHYSLSGTFFVPGRNAEGRPVLDIGSLRRLAQRFEIGTHTRDHIYLTDIAKANAAQQITAGKLEIEQILGHSVAGFCYPGGRLNNQIRQQVIDAGFHYARTTENFRLDIGRDRYRIPTTLQFFPHRKSVLLTNFLRHGRFQLRARMFRQMWASARTTSIFPDSFRGEYSENQVLHIWGHSWEIEERGLWPQLKNLLSWVSVQTPISRTLGSHVNDVL
jgi:hypothetical protein